MKKILSLIGIVIIGFTLMSCDLNGRDIYEITETTTTEKSSISCDYSISLDISNGINQISTYFILSEAHGTSPDNMFWADGIYWELSDMIGENDDVQTIEQSDTMNILKSFNISISSIEVYDFDEVLIDTWSSWEERSALEPGQYLIVITVSSTQTECVVTGSSIFVLSVN
jgi:hypothetical protein